MEDRQETFATKEDVAGLESRLGARMSRMEDRQETFATKEDVVGMEFRLGSRMSRIEGAQEHFATRADVEGVKAGIFEARADIANAEARQLRWMVAAIFGGISLASGAVLAITRLTMGG